jgi:peptide/nickel transport system substrate-binding protein
MGSSFDRSRLETSNRRFSVFRTWTTIVLAALIGFGFAGPRDNSLTIGTSQEPRLLGDLLNIVGTQAIASEVQLWIFDGLYHINLDAQLEPNFVTEVATVENGRLVITDIGEGNSRVEMNLTLRDDLRWSDGHPITTADVAFAYEMSQSPGVPLRSPDYYERLTVEVVNDLEFRVILEPGQSSDLVGSPIVLLPEHVMRGAWDEAVRAVSALDADVDAPRITEIYQGVITDFGSSSAINAGRMVYSGPFMPTRWTPGSAILLQRNPHYFNHPENADAYLNSVEYRIIGDTNALLFAIVTGAVEATSSVSITFDQALSPQVTARAADRYDIWFVPSATWEHLEVNQFSHVPQVADLQLDDVRTRQALIHAMDRQAMVDALFDGLQPVSHSNVAPFDPIFNPDVVQYEYDPERSLELLSELGWRPGADGILQRTTADGRTVRFELEFVTTAGNAVRERQQQFIAEDLRQVGIDVRINNAPASVVFSADFLDRAYDGAWTGLVMFAWVSSQASTLNAALYLCDNAPTPANNYSGQNLAGGCVPEYDELREQAVRNLDPDAARPFYQEMQRIFAEQLYAIPLLNRSNPLVVSDGLVNFVASTFNGGYGYPPARPERVGWAQNGAEKIFDQADYGTAYE